MSRYVIYSANEDALTGAGYWNEESKWSDFSKATIYQSKSLAKLPRSVGVDAKWKKCNEGTKITRYSITLAQGVAKLKNVVCLMASSEFEASDRARVAYPDSQVIAIQALNTVFVSN